MSSLFQRHQDIYAILEPSLAHCFHEGSKTEPPQDNETNQEVSSLLAQMQGISPEIFSSVHIFPALPRQIQFYLCLYQYRKTGNSQCWILHHDAEWSFIEETLKAEQVPFYLYPSYQIQPYEVRELSFPCMSERKRTLDAILKQKKGIYIFHAESLFYSTPSPEVFESTHLFHIHRQVTFSALKETLFRFGYDALEYPHYKGSYSVLGNRLLIFSPQSSQILRITFFDEEIETISYIPALDPTDSSDSDSTDSANSANSATRQEESLPPEEAYILSMREFIPSDASKKDFEKGLMHLYPLQKIRSAFSFLEEDKTIFPFLPILYQHCVFDFFSHRKHPVSLWISDLPQILSLSKELQKTTKELYYVKLKEGDSLHIPPQRYLRSLTEDLSRLSSEKQFLLYSAKAKTAIPPSSVFEILPYYEGNIALAKEHFLETFQDYRLYLCFSDEMERQHLLHIFPEAIPIQTHLSESFFDHHQKSIFFSISYIFGKLWKKSHLKKWKTIDHISQIEVGDIIVHIEHGIGIYKGLKERSLAHEDKKDYIHIEYADEASLFIPVEHIHFVHKFIGKTDPPLSHLGGAKWTKEKQKVFEEASAMTEYLVDIYQKRKQLLGFQHLKDTPEQITFEQQFPYPMTKGQQESLEAIKLDMEKPYPMDRLLFGDVGYGKTEVSFRAAFKAIQSGKQVAFLVPTTVLANQHYFTALERFASFPIQIGCLSRATAPKERKRLLEAIQDGSLDLLIGTHAMLSASVQFKDLGLLIIDEEHRFGVKQKEILKKWKVTVDVLTLSATPIPRTLQMGMSALRDMSVILTPPKNRLAIQTILAPYQPEILQKSISLELERGGQVFFLYNRIQGMLEVMRLVQSLFPETRIAIAHGQMPSVEMEKIFSAFVAREIDILICTTIIENGIDIPNANTIIIYKPEILGLAEIYQIRGRVGRGDTQGYAYLLYDDREILSPKALSRLEVITEHTELGSGIYIAMKDLEIRGSGNILGKDQSGLVSQVGLTLYSKILKEAAKKHTQEFTPEDIEPYLEIPYSGSIPKHYISDDATRFFFYREILRAFSPEEIQAIQQKLLKNFGRIPSEMEALFQMSYLRKLAKQNMILSIRFTDTVGYSLVFSPSFKKGLAPALKTYLEEGKILMPKPQTLEIPTPTPLPLESLIHLLQQILPSENLASAAL